MRHEEEATRRDSASAEERQPDVVPGRTSVVVYGRNDSHGYNLHKRASISFNCITEVLSDDDELIFVDYNTPNDMPTFPEAIQDLLSHRCKQMMRVIRVRPAFHEKHFGHRTHLKALEPISRNIAIRRSDPKSQWILSTNTDVILLPQGHTQFRDIARSLPDGYYGLPRYDIPETLWEGFDRRDPAATIEELRHYARRLQLEEVLEAYPEILFDGPGDFQLMSRRQLFEIDGFHEEMILGWHLDSNISRRFLLLNGRLNNLIEKLACFHCNHTRQATSLAHAPDFKQNDLNTYFFSLKQADIPVQRASWGYPDETFEEFRLQNRGRTFATALDAVVPEARPNPHVSSITQIFAVYCYELGHVFPYLADYVWPFSRDSVIGYAGLNANLLDQLARFLSEIGHTGELRAWAPTLSDQREALCQKHPGLVWVANPELIHAGADLLIFDFGVARDASITLDEASWVARSRLGDVASVFVEVTELDRQAVAVDGAQPVFFETINAINNVFDPLVKSRLLVTQTPMTTRCRHGVVRLALKPEDAVYAPLRVFQGVGSQALALQPMRPGDRWALTSDGAATQMLVGSWLEPDEFGVWSAERSPGLRIPVEAPKAQDVRLLIGMLAYMEGPSPPMRVLARIAGELAGESSFDKENPWGVMEVRARVPAGEGRLDIEFEVQDPRSPWVLGNTREHLPLGIRVESIRLLSERAGIELGEYLSADETGDLSIFLKSGWSTQEPSGRWSSGPSALIEIVPPDHTEGLTLNVDCSGYVVPGQRERQTVLVEVNGETVGSFRCRHGEGRAQRSVSLPRLPAGRAARIELRFPDAVAPSALGLSEDERALGVFLYGLTFLPQVPLAAAEEGGQDFPWVGYANAEPGSAMVSEEGWGIGESLGRWTTEQSVGLRVRLPKAPGEWRLQIEADGYTIPGKRESMRVDLAHAGRPIGSLSYGRNGHGRLQTISLPPDLSGDVDLELIVDQPTRPSDFGLGEDARNLGVFLRRTRITPLRKDIAPYEWVEFGGEGHGTWVAGDEGWGEVEPEGRWTTAENVILRFATSQALAPMQLEIDASPYLVKVRHEHVRVTIRVNGVACEPVVRYRDGDPNTLRRVTLPALSPGPVEVRLEIDSPARPSDLTPGSRDDRRLGLFVRRIRFAPVSPDLKADTWVSFASDGEGALFQGRGFSFSEPEGCWTDGETCELRMCLPPTTSSMVLELEADPFLAEGRRETMSVEVRINGEKVCDLTYGGDAGLGTRWISVPNGLQGEAAVSFHFSDCRSPKSLRISKDDRQLALYFRRLRLRERLFTAPVHVPIRIGEHESPSFMAAEGFGGAEPEGRWTVGPAAQFELKLPDDGVRKQVLIDAVPFLPPEGRESELTVRVEVNGAEAGAIRYLRSDSPGPRSLPLPKDLRGECVFRLLVDRPQRPTDLGLSRDNRALGLFIRSLQIEAYTPSLTEGVWSAFGRDGAGSLAAKGEGWGALEEQGRWTVGASSLLSFRLPKRAQDWRLDLLAEAFLPHEGALDSLTVTPVVDRQAGTPIVFRRSEPKKVSSILLPAGRSEQVDVELLIDRPQSPRDLKMSDDARHLGLFVHAVRVEPACPTIQLDEVIPIGGLDGLGNRAMRSGWGVIEPHGAWTDGPTARLSLRIPSSVEPTQLELHADPFLVEARSETVRVAFAANGDPLGDIVYRWGDAAGPRFLSLPQSLSGEVNLTLDIEGSVRPKAFGLSDDDRSLGVFLRSLSLRRDAPDVGIGESIDFSTTGLSSRFCKGAGWRDAEPEGRWLSIEGGRVLLTIPEHRGGLRLSIDAMARTDEATRPKLTAEIRANGRLIGEPVFHTYDPLMGPRLFALPDLDGRVEIDVRFKETAGPLQALFLRRLTLLPDRPVAVFDRVLDAGAPFDAAPYCGDGWSLAEPQGRWTDGPIAVLHVEPPRGLLRFTLEMRLRPFAPEASREPVAVTVETSGGVQLMRFKLDPRDVESIVRVDVPVDLIPDGRLHLQIANPRSPKDLGMSEDPRRLGVFLRTIRFLDETVSVDLDSAPVPLPPAPEASVLGDAGWRTVSLYAPEVAKLPPDARIYIRFDGDIELNGGARKALAACKDTVALATLNGRPLFPVNATTTAQSVRYLNNRFAPQMESEVRAGVFDKQGRAQLRLRANVASAKQVERGAAYAGATLRLNDARVAISNHPVLTPLESELRFGRYDPGRHLLSREHWRIERDAALSIVDDPYLGLRFSADALDRLKGVQPPAWVSIRLHPWKQVRRLVFRLEDVGIGEAIVPPGADRVDTSLALPSEALSPWRWTPLFMSLAWTSGEAESEPVFRLCRFAQQTQPLAGPRLSKHFDDPAYRLRRRLSGRG